MKNSNKKGFTLVELVVVIAIIGVLAAILVPSMMGYVKKSRLKTANGNAKTAYKLTMQLLSTWLTRRHRVCWLPLLQMMLRLLLRLSFLQTALVLVKLALSSAI